MALAPDPLLNSAAEMRPRSPAAKAPANGAEPRKNEASSFAQMYARERQAKAAERQDAVQRERAADSARAKDDDGAVAAEQSALADSGKPLPAEDGDPGQGDPALLLALAGQLPPSDALPAEAAPDTAGQGELDFLSSLPLGPAQLGSGPAGMTEASHDPQVDALNEANGLQLTLGLNAKAQSGPASQAGAAQQPAVNSAQGFAAAMAALGESGKAEGEVQLDSELAGELDGGLEGLPDNLPEVRNEPAVNRLTTLGQAIQQALPAQRAAEVPGQPLAPQAGQFSEALVDKVMWMSSQNLKSAEIQLDPAELGRLEVRVHMTADQTQVSFASANAGVRDALEGQMHRLREMLAQQGMNMVDVNVSDQSQSRAWQGQGDSGRGQSQFRGGVDRFGGDEEMTTGVSEIRSAPGTGGRGLVDYYA
ncbi:Flagellar hook-length control protein FliK [compost metagenome]